MPRPGIVVPFTHNNQVVGHTTRFLDNRTPKYIQDIQHGYVFGTDLQQPNWQYAIVVEGVFDALAINGLAVLHAEINDAQVKLIRSLGREVIVVPDQDEAGMKLVDRAMELGWAVSIPEWPEGVKDINDYIRKRDDIYKQLADPKQKDNYPWFKQALFDLMRTARQKGIKIEESSAHKKLATWFKNRELAQNFATGKSKIPTPQQRRAELEKPKKQIKEFGADAMSGATGQSALSQTSKVDPKQAQAITQATSALKSATQSSAPAPMIAKALDAASQGKPVGQQDMKALEPLMKDVATVAQEPKLAGQFKSLAQQIQQVQQKQQKKV
jgi:DNA primase